MLVSAVSVRHTLVTEAAARTAMMPRSARRSLSMCSPCRRGGDCAPVLAATEQSSHLALEWAAVIPAGDVSPPVARLGLDDLLVILDHQPAEVTDALGVALLGHHDLS